MIIKIICFIYTATVLQPPPTRETTCKPHKSPVIKTLVSKQNTRLNMSRLYLSINRRVKDQLIGKEFKVGGNESWCVVRRVLRGVWFVRRAAVLKCEQVLA